MTNLVVDCKDEGRRIDVYLSALLDISRSAAAKLCDTGAVLVNGAPAQKRYAVRALDEISVELPKPREYEAEPECIPLDIVYEDESVAVINKPSGMVVHPAPGNYTGTLVNAIMYHCKSSLSGIGGVLRPGIVHRIDKDTSGLLVIAKSDDAHAALSHELEHHGVEREYHALVRGGFSEDSGTIDLPIGRHPVDRKKMAVLKGSPSAREAITHYEVLERFGDVTYLKLKLETGRTHQIRVHMAARGHALLGDEVYAPGKIPFEKRHAPLFDGQILHAKRLSFTHPTTGERVSFECDLPENFKRLLEILKTGCPPEQ
ncbi:MAG: RluA family pseudouridine synthase [Clostridia bacterium]|nr:RluA family pseudouridine synthase [Clostridia bacterium]